MHIISGVPRKFAEFLGLHHLENYTWHCLRRSGANTAVECNGNFLPVKQLGGWNFLKVVEGYMYRALYKCFEEIVR